MITATKSLRVHIYKISTEGITAALGTFSCFHWMRQEKKKEKLWRIVKIGLKLTLSLCWYKCKRDTLHYWGCSGAALVLCVVQGGCSVMTCELKCLTEHRKINVLRGLPPCSHNFTVSFVHWRTALPCSWDWHCLAEEMKALQVYMQLGLLLPPPSPS